MQNAHLRMGTLTFVKQTRDTVTDVTVQLNQFIVAPQPKPRLSMHPVLRTGLQCCTLHMRCTPSEMRRMLVGFAHLIEAQGEAAAETRWY